MKSRLVILAILSFVLTSCQYYDEHPKQLMCEAKVIDINGFHETYVTYDRQFVHYANYLPNGERIIIVESGTLESAQSVYSITPDGSDRRYLFSKQIFPVALLNEDFPKRMMISSDSRKIVFTSYGGQYGLDLYSVNVDGSNMVNLTNNAANVYIGSFNISNDGKEVVYTEIHEDSTTTNYIYTRNIDGSNKRIVKSFTASQPDCPQFFPADTTTIVYLERTSPSINVLKKMFVFDTTMTSPLATLTYLYQYPQIISGKRLIYKVYSNTNSELYAIDLSTGGQQKIFSYVGMYSVSTNIDGTLLAWTTSNKQYGVIRSNGQIVSTLTADSTDKTILSPFITPSNKQILFRSITLE